MQASHFTGNRVFEPIQKNSEDSEAVRHNAARIATVHAFAKHLHSQRTVHHASERARYPQVIVRQRA